MIGTCEVFDLRSGRLIFSDARGLIAGQVFDLDQPRDLVMVRRISRDFIPRAMIVSFTLNELLSYRVHGLSLAESFSDLSASEIRFLRLGLTPSDDLGELE